jgi:hypothetical protein
MDVLVPQGFFIATLIMSILFVIWLLWRLTHPMECNCGFSTRLVWRLKRHVLMKHGWK